MSAVAERIPIAADHAGFELKGVLVAELRRLGFEPVDLGTDSSEPSDYPDVSHPLAQAVSRGEFARGVLLCGSGLGMGMVANRYAGVRGAVVWSPELAELCRRHNDANVLILPARYVGAEDALEMLRRFLATPFDGGRHAPRVAKIEPREPAASALSRARPAGGDRGRVGGGAASGA